MSKNVLACLIAGFGLACSSPTAPGLTAPNTPPDISTTAAVPAPAPSPPPAPAPPAPAPPSSAPVAASMALIAGNNQTAPTGHGIRGDIILRVADANGNAFPNATITLTAGNGGSVSPSSIVTNASGMAVVRGWSLGPAPGAQTLSSRAGDGSITPTVIISAIATGDHIVKFGDPANQGFRQR